MMHKLSAKPVAAARPARSAVVVRASAESRRAVLSGFLAGAAALTLGSQAQAVTSVDIFDDRKARDTGFDLIYEARDLDLPQNERDGLTQARKNLELAKSRVKESEARIDNTLAPYINKSYWTLAREELRLQVGTLRFDLNALADAKPKEAKKQAKALAKEFIAKVEDLDFSLRSKDLTSSQKKLEAVKAALDNVLASVL